MNVATRHRCRHYRRTLDRLHEGVQAAGRGPLSSLERDGVVRRFTRACEAGVAAMSAWLAAEDAVATSPMPRSLLEAARAAGLISGDRVWLEALAARSEIATTAGLPADEAFVAGIGPRFIEAFAELDAALGERMDAHG